jgi:hypothetical protein
MALLFTRTRSCSRIASSGARGDAAPPPPPPPPSPSEMTSDAAEPFFWLKMAADALRIKVDIFKSTAMTDSYYYSEILNFII